MKFLKFIIAIIIIYLIYVNLGKVVAIGNALIDKAYNAVVVK